jgi:hypothetical protein
MVHEARMSVGSKKGLSFTAARDYVLEQHGVAAWGQVLASMATDDASVLMGAVGMGWYPLELYARLARAIAATVGQGDLAAYLAIPRFEAERDIPTIHRYLLRMVRTSYVVEKMGQLWPRYHDTGRLTVVRVGERRVEATIFDWADDPALCGGVQAYCERALELAGARLLQVHHDRCRARGDSTCVLGATWDEASRLS